MDVKEVIIVEGKYDKIKLDSLINATIIPTDGFSIFKNRDKKELIKKYAFKRGLIILTDSDSAGMMIRNHLKSFIPAEYIKNAYVPRIEGKEKRKITAGKEGLLGVEGMTSEIILNALYKVCQKPDNTPKRIITKQDLISDGISGGKNSKEKREFILKKLNVPLNLNSNSMLDALNTFTTYEQYKQYIEEIGNR